MSLKEAFTAAMRALRSNGLRSALTTLGVVIGVAAVIVLVGIGDAIKAGFNSSFGPLSTQLNIAKITGSVPGGGAPRDLTDTDVKELQDPRKAPDIASVTPVVTANDLAVYDQQQFLASVAGSTNDYLRVTNRELVVGSMFTNEQQRTRAKVVVLGVNPVATLYGGNAGAAIGTNVLIGRTRFRVIGVVKSDGQNDDIALMPLDTARAYLVGAADRVDQIIVKAPTGAQVAAAQREIIAVLDEQHYIRSPATRDYKITTFQSQLEKVNTTLGYLTLFTVAVAGISLVVGGIGVANIMLVSVTERTREIGIRKAIGATRAAIMKQFLIESTVLAGLGGVAGILLGVGMVLGGAAILPKIAPQFGGAPDVSAQAVVISFWFSIGIGVLAGGYPALRASRLRPIEALRYQ